MRPEKKKRRVLGIDVTQFIVELKNNSIESFSQPIHYLSLSSAYALVRKLINSTTQAVALFLL